MAHQTEIGKEIVDMLMFSMYPVPCTIFREYIQNAYDSIREAVEDSLLSSLNDGMVYIHTDKANRVITIEDNGTGIPTEQAEQRLKDVGKSIKRYMRSINKPRAGWFGVGRLVGAGYCQKLTFSTTAAGENVTSELVFDVNKIREILTNDEENMGAGQVIDECTSFRNDIPAIEDEHKFIVKLEGILPDYSSLLDHNSIKNYIIQAAPLAYDMMFKRLIKKCDDSKKDHFGELGYIRISLNDDSDLKKAYSDIVEGTGDKIEGLCIFDIKDGDDVLAWGWYGLTRFTKQIEDTERSSLTRGIRLRVQNIQIGDLNYFGGKNFFREARANEYFNGEVIVVDDGIRPTSDRSDLEPSAKSLRLKELIKDYFSTKMQPVYKAASEAKKAIEHYSDASTKIDEVSEKPISESFTKEVKEDRISEYTNDKAEASSKFNALVNRKLKEETPEGVKKVIRLYEEEATNNNIGIVSEAAIVPSKATKKDIKQDNLDEKIQMLSPKYSSNQIRIVKKCFNLIDKFYSKKYPDLVKSIKYSIVNGLLG